VNGVDISPAVLEQTKARFAGDAEVSLHACALLDLALAPTSVDIITSVTVLQHVVNEEELVQSLRLLRSALSADGRMVLLELAPPHSAPVEIKDGAGYVYLLERPPGDWEAAFARAGFTVVERPVFPQFGIALLRGLSWLVSRVQPGLSRAAPGPASDGEAGEAGRVALRRRLMRAVFHGIRRAILFCAWPFDHQFRLPLPSARFRHYRIFVLAPNR
jgi:SAM-dependent methyltransferase